MESVKHLGVDYPGGFILNKRKLAKYLPHGVERLAVPIGVTAIGLSAFKGNFELRSVILPDTVTEIGAQAFYDCPNLAEIRMPYVSKIGSMAFVGIGQAKIILPECMVELKKAVFYGSEITAIYLPRTLRKIGSNCFRDTPLLKDVFFGGTEEEWKRIRIETGNNSLERAEFHFNARPDMMYDV